MLAAVVSVPLLARLVPGSLPIAQAPSVDFRVLLFAGLLTGLTGLGFGVFPALRASGSADLSGLREAARAGGGRKERLRSALVIAEVMASIVLLVSAGLLMRALWKLEATDPGFRADGVSDAADRAAHAEVRNDRAAGGVLFAGAIRRASGYPASRARPTSASCQW